MIHPTFFLHNNWFTSKKLSTWTSGTNGSWKASKSCSLMRTSSNRSFSGSSFSSSRLLGLTSSESTCQRYPRDIWWFGGDHKAFCQGKLNPKDLLQSYIIRGWLIATCAEQLSNCLFEHSCLFHVFLGVSATTNLCHLVVCGFCWGWAHGWSASFGSNDDRSKWTSGTCATNP